MRTTQERLNILQEKLMSPNFLEKQGLGNEMSYYIFDYDPKDELLIRNAIPEMTAYITKHTRDRHFQEFNLYDIIIDFFEERNYMQKNFKAEQKMGSERVIEKMQQGLKIATERDVIINYIKEQLDEEAIILITGVGKAYPIIRSHVVLNNLQSIVTRKPMIMFYPGKFENNTLKLFDIFHDDNYYRAFQIVPR